MVFYVSDVVCHDGRAMSRRREDHLRPAALKDQIARCLSVPKSINHNRLSLACRFGGPRIDESKPLTLSGSRPRIARRLARRP